MSKILITGSEGSLMQAVIPRLRNQGHEICGVDINTPKVSPYPLWKSDLTDYNNVYRIMSDFRPDFVIQAAALIYGVGGFNRYCADILGNDIALHRNVLKASVEFSVKKVAFISSSMVYENIKKQEPVVETDVNANAAPITEYGLSKYTNEKLSIAYYTQYYLPYVIWRPFNIITPHETAGSQIGMSHVFADYIHNIVEEKLNPLPILGTGHQVRCFTWIDDVAQAIADYSFLNLKNGIYNIGNPEPVMMKELANRIYMKYNAIQHIQNPRPLELKINEAYKNDVEYRVPNVEKIYHDFGWQPTKNLDQSLDECLMVYYRRQKW